MSSVSPADRTRISTNINISTGIWVRGEANGRTDVALQDKLAFSLHGDRISPDCVRPSESDPEVLIIDTERAWTRSGKTLGGDRLLLRIEQA